MTPDGPQFAHQLPHVLAQFDVDAGGRLVEKQDLRLVRQGLGDHQAALHAAREHADLGVFLVPQRELPEHFFDQRRIGRLAEQPARKPHGRRRRLEGVGGQFLRHEPDARARRAVIRKNVVAVDQDRAARRLHDAANRRDQGRLAGAVRAEQRENLAVADVQVDVFQGLEARSIGLIEMRDGDCGRHAAGRRSEVGSNGRGGLARIDGRGNTALEEFQPRPDAERGEGFSQVLLRKAGTPVVRDGVCRLFQ